MVRSRFIELSKENQLLTVFGNGKHTRTFTFIGVIIPACILLSNQIKGADILSIENEKKRTILDLANKILSLMKTGSTIQVVKAPKKCYDYEVERRFRCSDKLEETISFKAQTELIRA